MGNVEIRNVSFYTKIHAQPIVSKADVQGKIAGSYTPTIPPELEKKKEGKDQRMKIIGEDLVDKMETTDFQARIFPRAVSCQIQTLIIIKTCRTMGKGSFFAGIGLHPWRKNY